MLHVLVQPRENFFTLRGGDNVQLDNTIRALSALDVHVEISVDLTPDLSPYDLIHIYNFGEGCGELRYLINARRQNKPVVVMPIYWNLDRFRRAEAELVKSWYPPPDPPEMAALIEQRIAQRRAGERLVRSILMQQADLILPNSHVEAQLLQRDFASPPERMRVVYNGAEPFFASATPDAFFQQYGLRDFVLCVARISQQKNQLGLVRAWRDESVPLVLMGNDQEDPRYTEEVKGAAGPNTLFISHTPREQVASAYAASKVHALVSWFEMMPLAALEAGLAGCNLVLTTETAGPEFFGDKVWYCEPEDLASMRRAIHAALDTPRNPALATHIRDHFTWEKTAQATAAAYKEAIAQHSGRAHQPAAGTPYVQLLEDLAATLNALATSDEILAKHLWEDTLKLHDHIRRLEHSRLLRVLRFARKVLRPDQAAPRKSLTPRQ